MRSCSWVLVCGVATLLAASAGAGASETQVVSEMRHGACAPTDDGLGPCCFPSEGVSSADDCGNSARAFALWRDYCQDKACQHAGACRGPVFVMPRVQPRALLNPIKPSRCTCRACGRRTPVEWVRDVMGWSESGCASCGSCGHGGQVSMPMEPTPDVGPTPVVEDSPNSASVQEPSPAGPELSPDPSLPMDGVPTPDSVPEPAPAPKTIVVPQAAPPTQAAEPPATTSSQEAHAEPTQPMLDAPMPADVIPDTKPEPQKEAEPAAPQVPPASPDVPNQDLPPAVPENVLPPASGPAATPVSLPQDVRRVVPVRKATRLSEYIRVR